MKKDESSPEGITENGSALSEQDSQEKKVAYETYLKVLGERKNDQKKVHALTKELEDMKLKIDEMETVSLQSKGKLEESLKEKLANANKQLRDTTITFKNKILKKEFESVAKDYGCVDLETAFKIADFSGVEITDDLSFDSEGLQNIFSDLIKQKSYLFKNTAKAHNDAPLANKSGNALNIEHASKDDIEKLLLSRLSH